MTSFRIFQALRRELSSRYSYILINREPPVMPALNFEVTPQRRRYLRIGAGVILLLLICTGSWSWFLMPLLRLLVVVILSLGTLFNLMLLSLGTIGGVISVLRVSNAIVYEREQRRFDLIRITPLGSVGISWLIGKMAHQQSPLIALIRDGGRMLYVTLGGFLLLLLFLFTLNWWSIESNDPGSYPFSEFAINMRDFIPLLMAVTMLYIDVIQSIVVGVIAGILISTFVRDRLIAYGLSLGSYLGFQVLFYVVMALVAQVVLPNVYTWASINRPIAFVIIFYASREGLIALMWWWLARRLEVNTGQLNRTLKVYS